MRLKSALLEWVGRKIGLTDEKFWRTYYGTETWSAETVNPDVAMQVSTFWACVRLISQQIGSLPLSLYTKRTDGGRDETTDHPLYKILHDQPNADHTSVEFWEGVAAGLCLFGNSFAEKVTSGRRLIALNLLRPDFMAIERTDSGALRYRYRNEGKEEVFSEERIFHVRGFGMGGDLGLSPIAFARQSIGTSRAADRAASTIFANGMRPSGWLVYKGGTLKPEQREQIRKNLIEPMSGTANVGKVGILEADFDYRQMTIPPEDAQLLETRQFNVEEICRWHGVPPVLIGHAGSGVPAWGTGIETLMIGWLTLGLRPYLARIEKAIKRSLILPDERSSLYAEFNVEGLLRADSAGRSNLYSQFAQNGIMTRNEIRAKENLPAMDGGDVLTVQLNLTPLDKLGEPLPQDQVIAPRGSGKPNIRVVNN